MSPSSCTVALLRLQAEQVTDATAQAALSEVGGRVRAIASIHLRERGSEKQEELERDLYLRSSELERANSLLSASLIEKDALLREVHHRVKNNLRARQLLMFARSKDVT